MAKLPGSLVKQYIRIHKRGKRYARGGCLQRYTLDLADIIARIPTKTILDYGCGGGKQYTEDRIQESWGYTGEITLFDPGVPTINELPVGTFDGVICTGVLEHIPEDEIDMAINNLASYADKWAFIVVGIEPTRKLLPDGRQAHVTLQPPQWWEDKIKSAFAHEGMSRAKVVLKFEP